MATQKSYGDRGSFLCCRALPYPRGHWHAGAKSRTRSLSAPLSRQELITRGRTAAGGMLGIQEESEDGPIYVIARVHFTVSKIRSVIRTQGMPVSGRYRGRGRNWRNFYVS